MGLQTHKCHKNKGKGLSLFGCPDLGCEIGPREGGDLGELHSGVETIVLDEW